MGRRRKRKKPRGHYCWSCDCMLPNERFSGGGHARHICRACQRLGPEELELRQAVRDMERAMRWGPLIRRRDRPLFERFLTHDNPRIRQQAAFFIDLDRKEREAMAREYRRQEDEYEAMLAGLGALEYEAQEERAPLEDSEIPF